MSIVSNRSVKVLAAAGIVLAGMASGVSAGHLPANSGCPADSAYYFEALEKMPGVVEVGREERNPWSYGVTTRSAQDADFLRKVVAKGIDGHLFFFNPLQSKQSSSEPSSMNVFDALSQLPGVQGVNNMESRPPRIEVVVSDEGKGECLKQLLRPEVDGYLIRINTVS